MEIRIRAWDEKQKEMICNHDLEDCEVAMSCEKLVLGRFDKNEDYYELELMRATGIYDKENKEIYEGDILIEKYKCVWLHYLVCFGEYQESEGNKNMGVGFYLKALRKDNLKYQIIAFDSKYIEFCKNKGEGFKTIGNIYENPELMEVTE